MNKMMILLVMFVSLNTQSSEFNAKMEQTALLLCSKKIQHDLKMDDSKFSEFLILAPLTEKTNQETLSPCYQEALPLLSKCFLDTAQAQPQDDFGRICYSKIFKSIKIRSSDYLEKVKRTTLFQKRFAQSYQRCLKAGAADANSKCLEIVTKEYLPQIQTLQKKNLCQETMDCLKLLGQ